MEQIILSVAGNKNIKNRAIEDYLPLKIPLSEDDPVYLLAEYIGKETVDIYFNLIASNKLPSWLIKEFRKNKLLTEAINLLHPKNRDGDK